MGIMATTSFRQSFSDRQWCDLPFWHKLIGAYFCHGYGASCLRDLLVGVAPSLISHPTVASYYLSGFFLSYYSPYDFVYRVALQRKHPARMLLLFGETVDATTTILGSFEKAARLHPGASLVSPYACALLVTMGGSMFRYMERRGRGWPIKAEWTEPTGLVQKGTAYIIVFGLLRRLYGPRFARLWVTLLSCIVALYGELVDVPGTAAFNPGAWLVDALLNYCEKLRITLRLGPPPLGVDDKDDAKKS